MSHENENTRALYYRSRWNYKSSALSLNISIHIHTWLVPTTPLDILISFLLFLKPIQAISHDSIWAKVLNCQRKCFNQVMYVSSPSQVRSANVKNYFSLISMGLFPCEAMCEKRSMNWQTNHSNTEKFTFASGLVLFKLKFKKEIFSTIDSTYNNIWIYSHWINVFFKIYC